MSDYSAPSVARVADACRWVVLCDEKTPREWINSLSELPGNPEIALVDGVFTADTVSGSLRERGFRNGLTTRLDSDDALLDGWLDQIQKATSKHGLGVYSSPIGYQIKDGRIYWRFYLQNPFLTCNSIDGRTIYDYKHFDLRNENVHVAGWRPSWLQVIHGGNLANEVRGVRVRGEQAARKMTRTGVLEPDPLQRIVNWKRESALSLAQYSAKSIYALPKILRVFKSTRR